MSFLIPCPHCGARSVYEFRFGGEVKTRPEPAASEDAWFEYTYVKANLDGVQTEWWYHRSGCRQWLQAVRNTKTNQVLETYFPEGKT
jgi:heterotetrameric sarcosine oxidase delta subunit